MIDLKEHDQYAPPSLSKEYALYYIDPKAVQMSGEPVHYIHVLPLADCKKAIEMRIPQGKTDYKIISRYVSDWRLE